MIKQFQGQVETTGIINVRSSQQNIAKQANLIFFNFYFKISVAVNFFLLPQSWAHLNSILPFSWRIS